MNRVLSGIAILVVALSIIWMLPALWILVLAELIALFAFFEYTGLASRFGITFSKTVTGVGVLITCGVVGLKVPAVPAVLMVSTITLGMISVARGRDLAQIFPDVSAALFGLLYIGLPIGALVSIRVTGGKEALLLLLGCIVMSDTAQYYGGRAFGRRLLAPTISPNKTVEGAIVGLLAGTVVMLILGEWWLPMVRPLSRVLLGVSVVGLGIMGDLFESSLKRIAGVKDTSDLIPGHGGILDRIDGLLFATPLYYVVVNYSL